MQRVLAASKAWSKSEWTKVMGWCVRAYENRMHNAHQGVYALCCIVHGLCEAPLPGAQTECARGELAQSVALGVAWQ